MRKVAVVLIILSSSWLGRQVVLAQTAAPAYQELAIDPKITADEKSLKSLAQLKTRVITGQAPLTENAAQFDQWYKNYFFRSFTVLSELNKIAEKRMQLKTELRQAARNMPVHDYLLNMTFTLTTALIQPKYNFHPAVAYNAMLIIGDLNQTEQSAQQKFPQPLPAALDLMLAEFKNPAQKDAVRIAAQIGILRHAILDREPTRPADKRINAATRAAIEAEMLSLVKAAQPPGGRQPEAHAWMQRRGLEILAALGSIGVTEEVNRAIDDLIADRNASLTLRCSAASLLRHVSAAGQQKPNLDPADMSLKLGAIAVQACHEELDRIAADKKKEQEKLAAASGVYAGYGGAADMSGYAMAGDVGGMTGMMPGMGMMGMMPGMDMGSGYPGVGYGDGSMMMPQVPKDPRIDAPRRRLKAQLSCVQLGLNGLTALATADPARSQVAKVKTEVDALMKATDTEFTEKLPAGAEPREVRTLDGLVKSINGALSELEQMTQTLLPESTATDVNVSDEPVADTPPVVPAKPAAPASAKGLPGKSAAPGFGKSPSKPPAKTAPAMPNKAFTTAPAKSATPAPANPPSKLPPKTPAAPPGKP